MPRGQRPDSVARGRARLEQREQSREVLGAPDAEGNDSQVSRPDDAERHAFEIRGVRKAHRLVRQRAGHGDELDRPGTDAHRFALGRVPAVPAVGVDRFQYVQAIGCRRGNQDVGIQGGYRLRVAHLGGRPEQRVVFDDTGIAHAVKEFGDLFHGPDGSGIADPRQDSLRPSPQRADP